LNSTGHVSALLALHESARSVALDGFQSQALDRLAAVLPFDTAMWGLVADATAEGDAHICSIHLHGIDPSMMADSERVKDSDFIGTAATAALGQTRNFRTRDPRWSEPRHVPGVRHALKWGMENVLCTAVLEPRSGLKSFISLFRDREDHRFTEDERLLMQAWMPHLAAAFLTNRAWHVARLEADVTRAPQAAALADKAGALHDANEAFRRLLQLEWPQWREGTLPPPLRSLFAQSECARYDGQRINCQWASVGDVVLLRARRRGPVDNLTPRERAIARQFSRGLKSKEIARLTGLAPTTVRTHLSAVYRKLGVSHKQALARVLSEG
jgi:DNA-binding CsgD family transcriptional regulator